MRLRGHRIAAGMVALGLVTGAGVMVAPATGTPSAAAEGRDCADSRANTAAAPVTGANQPFETLRIEQAQAWVRDHGRQPGAGVGVAVVDAGVADGPVRVSRRFDLTGPGPVTSPHGTTVAGIIGGQGAVRGVAPDVELWSVQTFDEVRGSSGAASGADRPGAAGMVAGLTRVRDARSRPERMIVVVATAVSPSPALAQVLTDLEKQGVLVVAAAGDRPASGEEQPELASYAAGPASGEDAAPDVGPAAHPSVLTAGVGAAPDADVAGSVLLSSAVDVAAPTMGGMSYGLGGDCVLTEHSTEWAAAYVAGVAALVWSAHEQLTAAGLRARLTGTADGNGSQDSRLVGYGVIQPLEALRRTTPGRGAADDTVAAERAGVPSPREQRLADTRRDLVWWGLGGAAALLIGVLVRPLVQRRSVESRRTLTD